MTMRSVISEGGYEWKMCRVKYGDDRNAGQQDCTTKCRYPAGKRRHEHRQEQDDINQLGGRELRHDRRDLFPQRFLGKNDRIHAEH